MFGCEQDLRKSNGSTARARVIQESDEPKMIAWKAETLLNFAGTVESSLRHHSL